MGLVNYLKKAFLSGDWYVGYRKKNTEQYHLVKLNQGKWVADPFLFEYNGEHYLFVEYVEDKKGEIAYFHFKNGEPVFQRVVINEPYHLSYPCVFEKNGEIYMIPESADHCSIDLYRASFFPDQWEKVTQLAKGMYLDSTYYHEDGHDYLFSYQQTNGQYELTVFEMDFTEFSLKVLDRKMYKTNIGRPGGRCKPHNGGLIRVAQDCSAVYGKSLVFYQGAIHNGHYIEAEGKTVGVESIDSRFQRVHTYNEDDCYETVDFFKERFSLTRPFRLVIKKMHMKMQEAVNR